MAVHLLPIPEIEDHGIGLEFIVAIFCLLVAQGDKLDSIAKFCLHLLDDWAGVYAVGAARFSEIKDGVSL